MSRSLSRPGPRNWPRQLLAAVVVILLGTASSAFAQSPGCQVTATWPTWTGGNGFGASLDIRNTGPAINGWSLVFTMPNGQRVQNGWPVTFTQPAGSSVVTVASNAPWNASIPTNGVFNVAFNGTHSGTNNPPTGYTLNGVACTAPGGNTPPTVQITAPMANATVSGTAVALSATATDNSGVARVEFRIDNGTVTSDTTAPYGITFNASTLAAGAHTATATAYDNGNPALSATQTVTFNVGGGGNTPPTVVINTPINGLVLAAGTTSVASTVTATDPGGAVVRVEFRRGTTLIATDTSSPYSATITGLVAGANTISAQAFDNGTPSLSATASVTVTVGTAPTPTVSATPTSITVPGGQTASSTIRLSAAPTANTAVTIARTSGSTEIGPATQTLTLTSANWNTGVAANFTVAAGTTAASATFTASATGHTATTIMVSRSSGGNALFRVNAAGRVTKNGTLFPVRCGSWFGLEGRHEPPTDETNPGGAPMEQYIGNTFWANGNAGTGRTIAQTMSEIAGMGINVIRLPLVPQTLSTTDPQGTGSVLKNHPSVRIANSRLALETMIRAADAANIEIMLDVHSCSNYVGWRKGRLDARPPWTDATRDNYEFKREDSSCAASGNPAGVTRVQAYNTQLWLDNLRTLAGMSASLGVDNIIGIDIFNEPHDYSWAEWKSLTEQAYSAINTVNPNLLLFVQGIGTNAGAQDGTPATVSVQPHGVVATNPNWGENLFEAVSNPINVPKSQLVWSPHTYGPSVFVQKMFMDPAQTQCTGLEGDAAGDADCRIVINPTLLRQGWEEHFGFLKQQNFAIVVGEFGGNLDWPAGQAAVRDRNRWSHIPPGVDGQWQNLFVDWMVEKQIEGCYWSINPESGDTAGWYGHAYDPVTNDAGWGQWLGFDARKTTLLNRLWGR